MINNVILLGVNIDHVATLRQARGTEYPDPVAAALQAEQAGADSITLHLREDRRHIQDHDLGRMASRLTTHMNLEMALTEEMLQIAQRTAPRDCCLVPEKRAELTTEGGLDVLAQEARIRAACEQLSAAGIRVSVFIDPDAAQLDAAVRAGAPVIELHTGAYAEATGEAATVELERIRTAAAYAAEIGLVVNAGHGLNYDNVQAIAAIPQIVELNIGHAIVARAVFDGLDTAVAEMRAAMHSARQGLAT